MLNERFKTAIEKIENSKKPLKIVSHYDTDGITAAAIFITALKRWKKNFSIEIVKNLENKFIETLSEKNLIILLDLGSGSLAELKKKNTEIIIFDHHEITQEIPDNVFMINPHHEVDEENISAAAVCYFFAKTISKENKNLANLAVLGMVGDCHEKNMGRRYTEIINDSETSIKKGLLIYPSTRPLDRTLEYSSAPFIPGVTGSKPGVIELLKEAKINREQKGYKSISELNEEEMSNLITAIMLRTTSKSKIEEYIGNIFLVKFFNKLEDARELSALINSCSRMDHPETALSFCLGNKEYKNNAEKIYIEYKQNLISALKFLSESEKITGKKYEIINAKDKIKDTIIGTVTSIISRSPSYEEGTIIIALAYNDDKIKVSARAVGTDGRNVREVLSKAMISLGGEVGGHPNAAGCLIERSKESLFIEELKKTLEIEIIKP
jgi:RecJ-like exonuclease